MIFHAVQSSASDKILPSESVRARTRKPLVLVSLCAGAAAVGAALPWLIGYSPHGHMTARQHIDRGSRSLCEVSLPETNNDECKAALVDLRRRYEFQLLQ